MVCVCVVRFEKQNLKKQDDKFRLRKRAKRIEIR